MVKTRLDLSPRRRTLHSERRFQSLSRSPWRLLYDKVRELTVKQVSENEKMCVAGEPRRSEDAIQDIFHKVAQSKKRLGAT